MILFSANLLPPWSSGLVAANAFAHQGYGAFRQPCQPFRTFVELWDCCDMKVDDFAMAEPASMATTQPLEFSIVSVSSIYA
jgi:hypothetical protein